MNRTLFGLPQGHLSASCILLLSFITFGCQQSGSEDRCDAIAGDLVFSELMIDPAGADENKEWIEIFNASSRGIVLEGLVIERISRTQNETGDFDEISKASHALKTSRILSSGDYFVMGDADAVIEPLDYSYDERDASGRRLGAAFGALPKTPSGLILKCAGQEIDRVIWGDETRPVPSSGVALSLDGKTAPDSVLNDDFTRWCEATEVYDEEGNLGTPGQANLPCGVTTCEDDLGSRETVSPLTEMLLITEVFADPSGPDTGKEWIELKSMSESALDLNQVVIRVTKTDTGSSGTYALQSDSCLNVDAGERVVVGASTDLATNGAAAVDYVIDGFSLYNGAELLLEVLHNDTILDSALVPASEEAASWSLVEDGSEEPTWCLSRANGFFEGAGTPGVGNTCGATCFDPVTETWRVTRDASLGELLITELLADPEGADAGKEFVEVFNTTTSAFDLNGLTLSVRANEEDATPKSVVIGGDNCVEINSEAYAVFASETDTVLNGGLNDVVPAPGLSLLNSKPLVVTLSGQELIDQAIVPIAEQGQSWQVRPQQVSAGSNESEDDFCLSRARGIFEGLGTPAAANTCGFTCVEDGVAREVNSPELGDLIFTEVLANPTGADAGRDWVELLHVGNAPVDLNGVRIEASNGNSVKGWDLESETCLVAQPTERKVIGGQGLSAEGIVPFVEIGTATDTLFYASDLTLEVKVDDWSIDRVGPLSVSEGTSTQLSSGITNADDNDSSLAWCISSGIFPESPQGTPGEANGTCP